VNDELENAAENAESRYCTTFINALTREVEDLGHTYGIENKQRCVRLFMHRVQARCMTVRDEDQF